MCSLFRFCSIIISNYSDCKRQIQTPLLYLLSAAYFICDIQSDFTIKKTIFSVKIITRIIINLSRLSTNRKNLENISFPHINQKYRKKKSKIYIGRPWRCMSISQHTIHIVSIISNTIVFRVREIKKRAHPNVL